MAGNVENLTLGTGELFLDDSDVGFLKGDVVLEYSRNKLDFKPSGRLAAVKQFVIGEEATLRASQAEFNLTKLRQVLGVSTPVNPSYTANPSYNPASFDVASGQTYSILTFGGNTAVQTYALRFEHVMPDSNRKVVIIFYRASSLADLSLAFKEEEILEMPVAFRALVVDGRPVGDQLGMVIMQNG